MIWPLLETLSFVAPYFPPQLLSFETIAQLHRVAARLPNAASSYYLECRLDGADKQVDFAFSTMAANGGREELLAHFARLSEAGSTFHQASPEWEGIHAFCRQWNGAKLAA